MMVLPQSGHAVHEDHADKVELLTHFISYGIAAMTVWQA